MGKRSDQPKIDKGKYYTPLSALAPLLPMLPPAVNFIEPCAGDGRLADYLEQLGHSCTMAFDIEPAEDRTRQIFVADAAQLDIIHIPRKTTFAITNPPWPLNGKKGDPAVSIIRRMLRFNLLTWVLLPAEFMHSAYAADLLTAHCETVVSIGRVKWFPGTKHGSMESCCWYQFVPWMRVGDRGPVLIPRRTAIQPARPVTRVPDSAMVKL